MTRELDNEIKRIGDFSLTEFLNANLPTPLRAPDQRALEATYGVFEAAKRATKLNPTGYFAPWSVFRGLLTTQNSPDVIGPKMGSDIVEILRPASAIVQAGATVITGFEGGSAIQLPKFASPVDPSGTWTDSEGTAYPIKEPTFEQMTVTSHHLALELRFTRNLLLHATPAIEMALRNEILAAVMTEIDRVALVGDPTQHQPEGLLRRTDLPVVWIGPNGGPLTWERVAEMERTVAAANSRMLNCGWLTNSKVLKALRTIQRAPGLDFMLPTESDRLLGHPLRSSELVPSNLTKGSGTGLSALLFGDWSEVLVIFWGPGIDIITDGYSMATKGIIRLAVRCEVGIGVRRPECFAICKDIAA
jgi:HK97 family phage major capsid protein